MGTAFHAREVVPFKSGSTKCLLANFVCFFDEGEGFAFAPGMNRAAVKVRFLMKPSFGWNENVH